MKTITLTGWGQPHDALAGVAPNAMHIDYAHAADAQAAMEMIAGENADTIIGWSLGGQLAVRAIAAGLAAPKKLVLIATPYQFVAMDAMGPETFQKFYTSYQRQPQRTLKKAWELLHYEDTLSGYIADQLQLYDSDTVLQKDWLLWLEILENFSCDTLDFSAFPETLLIHGLQDKVVAHTQSQRMAKNINSSVFDFWDGCGHAPHLHDGRRLEARVQEFIHV